LNSLLFECFLGTTIERGYFKTFKTDFFQPEPSSYSDKPWIYLVRNCMKGSATTEG